LILHSFVYKVSRQKSKCQHVLNMTL